MQTNDLPARVRLTIESELHEGESIIWHAQPMPRLRLRSQYPILMVKVLFGLMFAAMVAPFLFAALQDLIRGQAVGGALVLVALCTPFVAACVFLIGSPYWLHREATGTAYFLTDRRAIIVGSDYSGDPKTVLPLEPMHLRRIRRRPYAGGAGDLLFLQVQVPSTDDIPEVVGFFAVCDAAKVEVLIENLCTCHDSSQRRSSV